MAELDPSTELTIETAVEDGVAVVSIDGELDSGNVDTLTEAIAAIAANRRERLVFDLARLRFMDSAGIAVLINAAREIATVELRNPSPIVRRVLEATGLMSVFEVLP
jgi:anti-anti-sigma factor